MSLSEIEKKAEQWSNDPFSKETQEKVKELYKRPENLAREIKYLGGYFYFHITHPILSIVGQMGCRLYQLP